MKSAFRVIHIIGGGEFGGAEDHIFHLLKQLRKEGVDAQVICFYNSIFANLLRDNGITVEVLSYSRFDFRLFFGLYQLLKEKNPDIIHTHGVKANFFGRLAAKKLNMSPVVTTVHSLLKYDYNPVSYRLAAMLENSTRRWTDYYIAISNKIKDQLLLEQVDPNKIEIIYHGIDTNKFSPKQDETAEKLAVSFGKEKGTFLIGAVGRIQSVKGFTYFIEACSKLHKKYPDSFRFVLIGDGPMKPEIESLIEKEGLTDKFYFAGFRDDVDQCLKALDCYVSSSLSEGLGLAVIEALATGVPVVTTGVGGVRDFAFHEQNCLVVEPKDGEQIAAAIERLYRDENLRKTLTSQAVADMRKSFSLEPMGKNTVQFYEKVLQK